MGSHRVLNPKCPKCQRGNYSQLVSRDIFRGNLAIKHDKTMLLLSIEFQLEDLEVTTVWKGADSLDAWALPLEHSQCADFISWLVVWNMNFIFHIWEESPQLSYFSRWLKPPTRWGRSGSSAMRFVNLWHVKRLPTTRAGPLAWTPRVGWLTQLLGWLLIVADHSRKFPASSTSKPFSVNLGLSHFSGTSLEIACRSRNQLMM